MAGFNTKAKNKFGEYEITFYTENKYIKREVRKALNEVSECQD